MERPRLVHDQLELCGVLIAIVIDIYIVIVIVKINILILLTVILLGDGLGFCRRAASRHVLLEIPRKDSFFR